MPRRSTLPPELQQLLLQIVDTTRQLPRHEQEWTLEPGGGQMIALSGDVVQVLDHDVLRLADMGFLHTTRLNYAYGNQYVITESGYQHAEIIRESQAVQVEPTGWAAVDMAMSRLSSRFAAARDTDDFKAVGLLCVSALEVLGRAAFDPAKHLPAGTEEPHPDDAKRRLNYFIDSVAGGRRFEHVRKIVRASYDQAQAVKHREQPNRTDAGVAVDSVRLLASIIKRLTDEAR
jgi:hypothetical protein